VRHPAHTEEWGGAVTFANADAGAGAVGCRLDCHPQFAARQAIGTQETPPRSVHRPLVYVNGTLTIRLNTHTVELVNTCLLKPYRS
jgi:hypothetical protein